MKRVFARANRSLCLAVGFVDKISPDTSRPTPNIPSGKVFLRVFKKLQRPEVEHMLQAEVIRLVGKLEYILPRLGEDVCVDATTIKSYARH